MHTKLTSNILRSYLKVMNKRSSRNVNSTLFRVSMVFNDVFKLLAQDKKKRIVHGTFYY